MDNLIVIWSNVNIHKFKSAKRENCKKAGFFQKIIPIQRNDWMLYNHTIRKILLDSDFPNRFTGTFHKETL